MEESDQAVCRAVLAGNKDAYSVLVKRHSPTVFRVAYRITGNEEDADEVVQEAFLRAYRKLAGFEGRASFATWIYRIASNCALDLVSGKQSEAHGRIAEETNPETGDLQIADSQAGPERLLLSHEIGAAKETAMRTLSATERTAFVLRHMEDRSTEEIAAALNIAPNAAKQAVFRAVQKLRRQLAPLWGSI